MSSVGAINQLPVFGSTATASETNTEKQDFLNLLVAQMKYQDPLNPLEGTEFAAQLAQFANVEELRNIGAKMDEQAETDLLLAQSVNNTLATTLIGKQVRAADNTVVYGGSDVKINYNLSGLASPVTITITTEEGATVRTMTIANAGAGDNQVEWDGRDNRGNVVPAGTYYTSIDAEGADGSNVTATPLAIGRIGGIRFENGSPVLLLNGKTIPFGSVLEILEDGESSSGWMGSLLAMGV